MPGQARSSAIVVYCGNFLALVDVRTLYFGGVMRPRSVRSWTQGTAKATWPALALSLCVLGSGLFAQESGQTPKPKDTGPPPEMPEEELVRLDRKLPQFDSVEDDAPFIYRGKKIGDVRRLESAIKEHQAYDYVLNFAKRQPIERLRKYSIKDVPVENFYREIRKDYLRELIHVEGKLALVQSMKPTDELQELAGINELFEVWVFPKGSNKLFCVVVSELPDGVKIGEQDFTTLVSFDAYYFKLWHYESRRRKGDTEDPDKRQWERAPLFLGKTIEVRGVEKVESTFSSGMLYGIVGGLGALCLTAVLLGLWFRKGDKHVRSQARHKIESQASFENIPDTTSPVNRISDQP